MKHMILTAAIVVVLAALGALWFVTNYEQVETKVRVGPSGAARTNPYLAAMRFMDRIGFKSTLTQRADLLDAPPARATLVLLADRGSLNPIRIRSLQRWVQSGGHLIVEPEPSARRDLLLDSLGIGRHDAEQHKPALVMSVELPGVEQALRITSSGPQVLDLDRANADLWIADAAGVRLASLVRGAGRVTVISGMDRFSNRSIGAYDNAELWRRILTLMPDNREAHFVRGPQALPLWGWLRDHAAQTIAAAIGVIMLWLWHVVPRFGPVRPASEPARKQLLEHIRASGRFRWAQGARAELLEAARDVCHRQLAAFQPRLAHLPNAQRYRELSQQIGTAPDLIARAFEAPPLGARDFVQIVDTLARIHARVGEAVRPRLLLQKRR